MTRAGQNHNAFPMNLIVESGQVSAYHEKGPMGKIDDAVTPKISDRPAAAMNREDASAKPLSICTSSPDKSMIARGSNLRGDNGAREASSMHSYSAAGRIFRTSSSDG